MQLNKFHFLLLSILVFALVIRFIGAKPGYNKYHSDEGISYSAAVSMVKNNNLDPLRYDYPAVVPLTNYILFKYIFIPIWWLKFYITHIPQILDGIVQIFPSSEEFRRIFQLEILGEREINAMFWGRYVTVLLSTGSVYLVYLLGGNLINRRVGIIAALFLAVNFRAILNSHIGLPDSYNAFFLLLSLLLSLRLVERPTKKSYLLAGVAMGLSFSTKYQFFSVFPFIVSHMWSSYLHKNWKLESFILRPLLSGLMMIFTFLLLNPYLLIHFEEAYAWITSVSLKYSMGRKELMTYPLAYFYNVDFGPFLFISMILGIFYASAKLWKESLFLMGYLFPFMFMTLYYSIGGFYVRNFVTVTPLLLMFAAVGVDFIYKSIFRKLFAKAEFVSVFLLAILVFTVIYPTAKNSYIHTKYFNTAWSYETFPVKANEFIGDGDIIVAHGFDPLPPAKKITRIDFESDRNYSLAEFRKDRAKFAVINMDWAGNQFYGWMNTAYPQSIKYWNKPTSLMKDSFWGIAIYEMLKHAKTASYKPWQAPDAALFLVEVPYFDMSKFVKTPNINNFEEDLEGWQVFNPENSANVLYLYDKTTGKISSGSIKVGPGGTGFHSSRIYSPGFEISEKKVYKVSAQILSNERISLNQRNIFLRIDYYLDNNLNPIYSSVSPRYFGSGWQEISFESLAPSGANKASVSVQLSGSASSPYWVDDISIEESSEIYANEKDYMNIPESDYVDLLFPYSHGNL